jgi:hypothetical protein
LNGSGFRVQGSGFRVQGSGFRVQGSGFMIQGSGFRAHVSRGAERLDLDPVIRTQDTTDGTYVIS